MAKKDGILSIGFEYKSELNRMINDLESGLNGVANDNQLSDGMKEQLKNVITEIHSFKSQMEKEFSTLNSSKVNKTAFKSFKESVAKNFKSIQEDIEKLFSDMSDLSSKIEILSDGVDISKILNSFSEFKNYVAGTNDVVEQLMNTLGNQDVSLTVLDQKSVANAHDIVRQIDNEIKKLDKDYGAKFELFDEEQSENELNKLAKELASTLQLVENTKQKMSTMDNTSFDFKETSSELSLLELKAARLNDTIKILFETTEENSVYPIMDEQFFDIYEKYAENLSNRFDDIVKSAEKAKNELSTILDDMQPEIKVSGEINKNSNQLQPVITIDTNSSDLWEKLSKVIKDLQEKLNANPIIAPVKLVVAPTAVSQQKNDDIKVSENYSKKYQKVLAKTGEDAVIDLEGVYKKTFTSIMDAGVSYAKETINKIKSIFEENPIPLQLQIDEKELDQIQNFVLSNKDGKKIDISGQIIKAKNEVENLNRYIENTNEILKNTKLENNAFNDFDNFTKNISKSIGKLEELNNILKALQNIEITISKASGLSSITEIESQWENLEKRIIDATKLDGTFRKNANISKIIEEYQKYIDMGGTNSIADISKIKENKDTINSILSKIREVKNEDITNDSVDKLTVDLDGVVSKFDELISTVKIATDAICEIIKQSNVSELDKQWSSISDQFKNIADKSGKINLVKQKKDIQDLLSMYQEYVDLGGKNTFSDLTDNLQTVEKLEKTYSKINEVKSIDNSSTISNISKESEKFKEVEESVYNLTTAIGETKVKAINDEATSMEIAAEREIKAISSIAEILDSVVEKLNQIKNIKISKIKIENISVTDQSKGSYDKNTTEVLKEESNALKQVSEDTKKTSKSTGDLIEKNEENAKIWKELTDAIKRYSTVSKRMASGKELKTDNDEFKQLKKNIDELQQCDLLSTEQIQKSKELLSEVTIAVEDITKNVQRLNDLSNKNEIKNQISSYQKILSKYTDESKYSSAFVNQVRAISDNLKDLKEIDIANPEDVETLRKIKDEIETIVNDSKNLENKLIKQDSKLADIISKMKIYRASNTNMSNSQHAELTLLIDTAEQLEKTGKVSAQSIEDIKKSFSELKSTISETGNEGLSVIDKIAQRVDDMNAKFFAQFFSFQDWIRYLREAFTTVREIDTALTEMRKVSDESLASLKRYQELSFDVADEIGSTSLALQDATADWMRLGESLTEASESAKTATILLNVSEFENISDATNSLVSMSQAYQELNKMEIIDVLDNIGNKYSIATDELSQALQNSAAVLKTQGNDLYEAVALITAGNAITQDFSKTAGGIRTISLRLAGTEEAKDELASLGEDVDDFIVQTNSKTQQLIKDYTAVASNAYQGIDVLDANGNLRNTYNILLDISRIYKEIQEEDQKAGTNRAQALVEYIAGKNRSNIASSILLNPELLENVYESAKNSEGAAMKELDAYLESLDAKIAQFQNRLQELETDLVDSDFLKGAVDFGTEFIHILDLIIKKSGKLSTIGVGAGLLTGLKNVGSPKMFGLSICFEYTDSILVLLDTVV